MIEKKEDLPGTPDAETLAQTCLHLEATMLQAQSKVQSTFIRLAEALRSREKQLLRQIDVAYSQQLAHVQSSSENTTTERVPHVTVKMDTEKSALDIIASLGSVGLSGGSLVVMNGDGSFLQSVEDYQDASQDHMSMFKPVPLDSVSTSVEEAVIRFTHVSLPQNSHNSKSEAESEAEGPPEKSPNRNCEVDDHKQASSTQKRQHPTQVQQWLKQLSAETETEPSIGEPKNFEQL